VYYISGNDVSPKQHQKGRHKKITKRYCSLLLVYNYWKGTQIKHNRSLINGEALARIDDLPCKAGKNFGSLFVFKEQVKAVFIEKILRMSRKGKLAMLLVLGRILVQGSRRYLAFWKEGWAIEEVLGVSSL